MKQPPNSQGNSNRNNSANLNTDHKADSRHPHLKNKDDSEHPFPDLQSFRLQDNPGPAFAHVNKQFIGDTNIVVHDNMIGKKMAIRVDIQFP